jgi:hypothetical protein
MPQHAGLELAVVGRNLTNSVQRNAVALNKDDVILPGRDLRVVVRATFRVVHSVARGFISGSRCARRLPANDPRNSTPAVMLWPDMTMSSVLAGILLVDRGIRGACCRGSLA